LNDVVFRSLRRAQVQASKESLGLLRPHAQRPDGVTLIPWCRGRCLTLDLTVPDTFAASHLPATLLRELQLRKQHHRRRRNTRNFRQHICSDPSRLKLLVSWWPIWLSMAIETSGFFNQTALKFSLHLPLFREHADPIFRSTETHVEFYNLR